MTKRVQYRPPNVKCDSNRSDSLRIDRSRGLKYEVIHTLPSAHFDVATRIDVPPRDVRARMVVGGRERGPESAEVASETLHPFIIVTAEKERERERERDGWLLSREPTW